MQTSYATLRNPPARPGVPKAKNTATAKPHGKVKNKAKGKAKNKTTTTALVKRPAIGPAAVAAIGKQAVAAKMATLKASGALTVANKKKHKKRGKRRNGAGGMLGGLIPSFRNPSIGGLVNTLKTGAFGLAGGGASTIIAAVILAIMDRVAPTYAQHRYAQAAATLVAAIVALPLIASVRVFRLAENSRNAMVAGGVLFSLGQGFQVLTGRDVFGDTAAQIRTRAGGLFPSTGNAAADAAAVTVLKQGGTKHQAAAAASGVLQGLRGPQRYQGPPVRERGGGGKVGIQTGTW